MFKPPKQTCLIDVCEEHLEEIAFLSGQRRQAVASPDYRQQGLEELDGRIEAHVEGVLVAGEQASPLLAGFLASEDRFEAFAAALVLLRQGTTGAVGTVLETFLEAGGDQLDGICDALCCASIEAVREDLAAATQSGPPTVACAAAQVLASHGRTEGLDRLLPQYLAEEDPVVRRSAWKTVAMLSRQRAR